MIKWINVTLMPYAVVYSSVSLGSTKHIILNKLTTFSMVYTLLGLLDRRNEIAPFAVVPALHFN